MEVTIYIPPQGKARARAGKWGHYTPLKTVQAEAKIKEAFREYMFNNGIEPFEKDIPLEANIVAFYPIPKSYSKKKTEQALKLEIYPTKKPDRDNVEKLVFDALNGVAYHDDSQICSGKFTKIYGSEPCLIVEIRSMI